MDDQLPETITLSGWHIRYGRYGSSDPSAKTVVFVHGTPWSSKVFIPIVKAISACYQFRILLYDLAGYGQSQSREAPSTSTKQDGNFEGDTSVKAQAEILSALLAHLQVDGKGPNPAPAVIAHDIAGTIVLRAHLLHGCKFSSMLLLDTNTVLPWGDGFYKQVRSSPETFLAMPPLQFEAVVRATVKSAICRSEELGLHAWVDALTQPWLGEDGQKSFVRQIAQADDADVAEMLDGNLYERVACPVKIMWGEKDTWIPREKMDRLKGMLEHCLRGFVVVPDAGHLVMIDQPERVMAEVVSWLTQTLI